MKYHLIRILMRIWFYHSASLTSSHIFPLRSIALAKVRTLLKSFTEFDIVMILKHRDAEKAGSPLYS